MAQIFATNSPQYLEYVTRNMTRQEIENDPILCQWLNNPYTKDNMELAIRFNNAEDGDFQDKKDFVEYFFCNGPEVDADTMLFYREKILLDDQYRQIAYTYYMNMNVVDYLRSNVYNKDFGYVDKYGNKKPNCFKMPCDYLEPISCRILTWEDAAENSSTPNNTMAERRDAISRQGNSQFTNGPISTDVNGALPDAEGAKGDTPADVKTGGFPKWCLHLFPPSQLEHYFTFVEHRNQQNIQLTEELARTNCLTCTQVGDSKTIIAGEVWKLLVKANTKRHMGDCDRLLRQMAEFNPLDPAMNKRRPIQESEIVKNTAPDGSVANQKPNPTPHDAAPPSNSIEKMMENGMYRQLVEKVKGSMGGDTGDGMEMESILSRVCYMASQFSDENVPIEDTVTETEFRYWVALYLSKKSPSKMNAGWTWEKLLDEVKSKSGTAAYNTTKEALK